MADHSRRDVSVVLSYLVGRPLRAVELAEALGVSRSAYYLAREEDRLATADNLLRFAAALDLNPVDLLLRYGLVDADAVRDCANDLGAAPRVKRPRPRIKHLEPRADASPM